MADKQTEQAPQVTPRALTAEQGRAPVRSRFQSFRDVYVAIITQNDEKGYVAETPVKLARAIKGSFNDKKSSEQEYSDDNVEDTTQTYEGTEIEIEVNTLAPQELALIFGHKFENGFLSKNKNDIAPELAIGFRAKRKNGKYEFRWYYCGVFAQGYEESFETEGKEKKTQTSTAKGSFYARQKDGEYLISVDESNIAVDNTDAAAAIKEWFAKVQEKTAQSA